ncbi:4-hydroxythreonine-4-phosphate dehydrogenase [Shimia gijangensis]|uniref:4-hydroxythreonine-4-phosphate dehydrogenase n=1 Tax=Shimia gijangensis TaxID=1470563 RepID=A0A1M6HDM0_9RHOB|nr:4-hydroxythreonine-4-phosphate dehydrogenase PdxA [Shimia gijangensis]SHJ20297.1 4-hydroxythreonine-4-phosphate dehydrogenase [Shimia gijangensis]
MTPLPIALSCGEPAGVGLELAEKAWQALRDELAFFLIADPFHLPGGVPVILLTDPAEATAAMPKGLPVLPMAFDGNAVPGAPDSDNASAIMDAIALGTSLAMQGKVSALCTAPIHKKALKDGAGFGFPGHTEYLAHLAGVENVVMMLASEQLKVVPATIHISLSDVPKVLTPQLLRDTVHITARGLQDQFGIENPRIAIAGLNPHAGEGGAMGMEELDWINETITQLIQEGYDLIGPLPADTMFHTAARSKYDAAIAMYHDQALIPIKTLDFDKGVNVTLGLPFIRTSPDHGTAFDIAGQGIANPSSLVEALKMAARMARSKAGV